MKIDKDITFSVILVNYKDRTVSEIVRLSDETEADILCKKLNDALDCCEHEVRVEFSVRHNHSDLGKHFESRRRPGRMLKEDEEGSKVIARQSIATNNDAVDDCSYDEILVYMDGGFVPGSGHTYGPCTKYADTANRLKEEYEDLSEEEQEEYEDFETYVMQGLDAEFGGDWSYSSITGSVQGEHYEIIYPKKTNSEKHLKYFENAFFGRGWNYDCYQDDKYLVNVFVNEMDEDQTKEIIADVCGCDEEDVVIEYDESHPRRGRMLREGRRTRRLNEEHRKVNQRELRQMVRDGFAEDITDIGFEGAKRLKEKEGYLDVVGTGSGVYGVNCAWLQGAKTGTHYVVTARNSTLLSLV